MQTSPCRAVVAAAWIVVALAGGVAAEPERMGRLDVAGGSMVGDLVAVPEADGGTRDTFLWRSPRFVEPFEFRIGEVAGITFPQPANNPEPSDLFVRLRGGDVLAATVDSLDADALVATIAGPEGPQRLRIARAELEAISRTPGTEFYSGPAGLAGWEQVPAGAWRDEAGRIMTDKAGATASRDVAAPKRARFDIQIARDRQAEFRVVVAAADKPADDGYVLEAINVAGESGLMLVRRAGGRAAIESLPANAWRGDRLRITLFVDQERGRLAAMLPDAEGDDAKRVTEVTLPPTEPIKPSGRFRLELTTGRVGLERLTVDTWRAEEPTLRDTTTTAITTRTGSLDGFEVTSFDAGRGEFVVSRGGETRKVAAAEVEEIRFAGRDDAAVEPAMRVVLADRCALGGELVKIDDRAVWLRRRGIDAAVALPRDVIVTIRSQRPSASRGEPTGRVGTLVIGPDRLRGALEPGPDGGLGWRPLGSVSAAGFAERPDAELEYVARRPEKKPGEVFVGGIGGMVTRNPDGFFFVAMLTADGAAAGDGRLQPGDRIIAIAPREKSRFIETKDLDNDTVTHLLRGRLGAVVRLKVTDGEGNNPRDIDLVRGPINVAGREVLDLALQTHLRLAGPEEIEADPQAAYPSVVVLRSGDVAPCRVEAIDADAVRLRSPLAGGEGAPAVRVPVDMVKAVELVPAAASRALDRTLRERLLTLPRMQRDRPPTHLLRLLDGDYLRGRLLALDDASVTFEVLDVVKKLPRKRVARIIWLHPDVPKPEGEPPAEAEPEPDADGLVVQGVSVDGRRMTLMAETVEGTMLRGRSRAFGDSAIDLSRVDRLLIGAAVGRDVQELPFANWVLKPAPEPRALSKPEGE